MKKLISLSFLIMVTVMVSCDGNKGKADETATVAETEKAEVKLTIVDNDDPCGPSNGTYTYLLIENGVSFADDAAPFKVEAKYPDGSPVDIELDKFVMNDDGSAKVNFLSMPGANNEEGDPIKITVTDANGTYTKDYTLIFCL